LDAINQNGFESGAEIAGCELKARQAIAAHVIEAALRLTAINNVVGFALRALYVEWLGPHRFLWRAGEEYLSALSSTVNLARRIRSTQSTRRRSRQRLLLSRLRERCFAHEEVLSS